MRLNSWVSLSVSGLSGSSIESTTTVVAPIFCAGIGRVGSDKHVAARKRGIDGGAHWRAVALRFHVVVARDLPAHLQPVANRSGQTPRASFSASAW